MKKLLFIFCAILTSSNMSAQIVAPQPSPASTVNQVVGLSNVTLPYSRPAMRGRNIFGGLVPFGEVWRTGANEATEIKFFQDMTFGGKTVKAGEYSLFTIPGEKEWTIILNTDINVWGAYSYKEANDVIRISAPVSSGESLEAFSIAFSNDGTMHLGWGTVRVAVPFTK